MKLRSKASNTSGEIAGIEMKCKMGSQTPVRAGIRTFRLTWLVGATVPLNAIEPPGAIMHKFKVAPEGGEAGPTQQMQALPIRR